MSAAKPSYARERESISSLRALANQAFSRASGAPLVEGNGIRLLKDARENYPAWLDAIRAARRYIHFESYIIHEDDVGRSFAEALLAKTRQGIHVRLIYDWMGGLGSTSRSFWNRLRAGGVEVRCYNPLRLDSPFGWLSRDHRKMLAVDGQVAFVSGLCVGRMWAGVPEKHIEPWRDTGVEVRGPAVGDIEQAFAAVWATLGEPVPEQERCSSDATAPAGDFRLRIVASEPATAGLFRLDQLVAALAVNRLWLTDAYYSGTAPYVQALRAAAQDGVDVRLLVPSGTDLAIFRPLSRAGYRPLLEVGIRVFEWNGTMLHAKTAVADSHWARVGSTNLNISSWFGNCELDVVVEDKRFAGLMEDMYLQDLENATEIILDERHKIRVPKAAPKARPVMTSGGGSRGRAAAGAIRIGKTVGAAVANRRVLEPVESRVMFTFGALLLGLAIVFIVYPRVPAYTLTVVFAWLGAALLYRGCKLRLLQGRPTKGETPPAAPSRRQERGNGIQRRNHQVEGGRGAEEQ